MALTCTVIVKHTPEELDTAITAATTSITDITTVKINIVHDGASFIAFIHTAS